MGSVSAPRRRRHSNFDFAAKRRREIVLHARHVGAAETEDFSRWLIAWVWHNRSAKDQIWSVMECAKNMGGKVTEAEASAITEEASITRKHLTADSLARFLGVTYADRQTLRLTTIGSVNVKKGARKELRRRRDRMARERKRRASGMRPRAEYEANSLSATKPWEALNMSRRTWERHRNRAPDAKTSAAIFLSTSDEIASRTQLRRKGLPRGVCDAQASMPAAGATMAVDDPASVYCELPIELRLLALGLGSSKIFGSQIGVAA